MQESEKLSCRLEPINFCNKPGWQKRRERWLRLCTEVHTSLKSQVPSKAGSGCLRAGKTAKSWAGEREKVPVVPRLQSRELARLTSRSRQPNYQSKSCSCRARGGLTPSPRGSLSPPASSASALSNHRRLEAEVHSDPALPELTQVRRGSVSAQSPRRESRSANRREAREGGLKRSRAHAQTGAGSLVLWRCGWLGCCLKSCGPWKPRVAAASSFCPRHVPHSL